MVVANVAIFVIFASAVYKTCTSQFFILPNKNKANNSNDLPLKPFFERVCLLHLLHVVCH